MSDATRLLEAVGRDDAQAAAALLPLVYDELRRLARAHMAYERAGHTLQATALVHEPYVRLVQDAPAGWDGRRHFFAAAAEAMRRILIEHARGRRALKRGGAIQAVEFDHAVDAIAAPCADPDDVLALNEPSTVWRRRTRVGPK